MAPCGVSKNYQSNILLKIQSFRFIETFGRCGIEENRLSMKESLTLLQAEQGASSSVSGFI